MTKLPDSKLDVSLIALDLDDTLLNHNLEITPKTINSLQKACKKGIYVTLCSGRAENAILPFVKKLEIQNEEHGRFIISMNGSAIFDIHEQKKIFSKTVDSQILKEVFLEAKKRNLPAQVYDSSTIYANIDNDWTRVDAKLCNLKLQIVSDFENFMEKGHAKMVIPGNPEILQEFQAFLKQKYKNRAVIFVSKPYFLEIMPPNSGKGEAIEWLCKNKNIDLNKTMSFGDSMNDESMILKTKYSVAMLNGMQEIKTKAKFITQKDNENDGIADFLEKFVL